MNYCISLNFSIYVFFLQTAISPVRTDRRKDYEPERLSYNDELFLKGGNALTSKSSQDRDVSGSSKFDESWPSTDRPLRWYNLYIPLTIVLQSSILTKGPEWQSGWFKLTCTDHCILSPIRREFVAGFVPYKNGCV